MQFLDTILHCKETIYIFCISQYQEASQQCFEESLYLFKLLGIKMLSDKTYKISLIVASIVTQAPRKEKEKKPDYLANCSIHTNTNISIYTITPSRSQT